MPLWKWTVEPVYLSRGLNEKCDLDDVLDTTCHRTLVATLQQLTCLLKLAHYVFTDIGEECESVQKKTESLRQRVEKCETSSQTLNSRSVSVPVGNIDLYCQVKDHYITTYVQESKLIVSSNRPIFVSQLYDQAAATPLPLIRAIDRYRNDGLRGSKIFTRTPVLGEVAKRNKNLDIETRRPASFALARDWDELEITLFKNECSGTCPAVAPSRDVFSDLDRLPSPEERIIANAMEYPSTMVPIDVTESSFRRMSSLRRSLLHVDFFIKRKKQKKSKRRNTISGSTSKELEEALKATSSKSPCLVDTSCQTDECNETSWLGKIFNKRNSLIKKEKKSPQEENNNNVLSKLAATVRNRDSVSLFDTFESSKSGKKSERNSLVIKEKVESGTTKKTPATNKNKGKSILPISTLSAAMTVAVKMRQSKKNGDDGRSSSGNWSATSSTRVSVDSDQQHITSSSNGACSPSQSSLGKDSVLSDYTPQDTDTSRSQEGGRTGRSMERRPTSMISSKHFDENNTQTWLQSLEQECQSGTLTPENCPSDSTSTPHVLSPYVRRRRFCQNESSPPIMDDEGSSVYSVDTDGYYTSMHTDSGLKARTPQHENACRGRRDSGSSVSTLGNMSINSLLSRATIGRSSKSDSFREERKIPPPPPIRISSVKRDSVSDASSSQNGNGDTSTSESSDRDTVERLKQKTAINSSRYPSMCAVSPEPSDDESAKPKPEETLRDRSPPKFNMYSDQSPQNSKFVSLFCRNSPERKTAEQNQSLVTSFSPECSDQFSFSPKLDSKWKEDIKNPVPSITSTVFTDEGKSTIKRVAIPPASKLANQSKSCSLIPKAVDRPVARVTLDPNGRVIYASNSLGRRRDGHAMRALPSPIQEQKFATLPMRRAHCASSAPVVAHNGTFLRIGGLNQSGRTKSPTHKELELHSSEKAIDYCSNSEKSETNKMTKYGYRRTACGPRLPMNGYKPISVSQKNSSHNSSGNDENTNSSSPNGHIPTVPPQMPPLSRFTKQHSITGNNESSVVSFSYKGIGSQHVPSSLSVQSSLRSIASYSPYQSPIYGGVPKVQPTNLTSIQSTTPVSKVSLRPSILFPHSKTSPSLSSAASSSCRSSPRLNSSFASSYQSNCNMPQKQVSFHPSTTVSLTSNKPMQNGIASRTSPTNNICSSFSSPNISTNRSCRPSVLVNVNRSNNTSQSVLSPSRSNDTSLHSLNNSSYSPNKMSFSYSNVPHCNGSTEQNHNSKPSLATSNGGISPSRFQSSHNSSPNVQRSSPNQPSRSFSPTSSIDSDKFRTIETPPPLSSDVEKKTMTAADLFTLIHNSKKKHNIKTDLDVSSSSVSSRSSSPSCSSVTSGKSVLAETGFLSPRNQVNTPRDRRSWISDFRVSSLPPSDRRNSLANDRLGPAKPTSMYDFKMLLLQANRSMNDSPGLRMSAAERLRVQPRDDDSPRSLPTSPVRTPIPIITGHSTVPIKRGSKSRSSIRYDLMYQPILEDCCEESEAQKSPKTPPCRTPLETSFINSTPNSANHLPPPQHWTQDFVPIRVASSRGASTWV